MDSRSSSAQFLEALIQQYSRLIFHTIYGLTGDWEESQDLTQDTFHQALKGLDAARASSGPLFQAKPWLLRIAINTVRMHERRRHLFRFIPFSHLGRRSPDQQTEDLLSEQAIPVQPGGYGDSQVDDPADSFAERDLVSRTLQKLPEQLRTCLLLSLVSGLSSAEIAKLLSLKEPAVRQRLSRARKLFQSIYQQESGETLIVAPEQENVSLSQASPRLQQLSLHIPQHLLSYGGS